MSAFPMYLVQPRYSNNTDDFIHNFWLFGPNMHMGILSDAGDVEFNPDYAAALKTI
jgi:hypothetical protein